MMLLADLGSVLTLGLLAILLVGWLITYVRLKLAQWFPKQKEEEEVKEPSKYEKALDRGVEKALETLPSLIMFFVKCTFYAVMALAILAGALSIVATQVL